MAGIPEKQHDGRKGKLQVNKVDERILFIKEPPYTNPESIDQGFDLIEELSKDWDNFYVIVEFPTDITIDANTRARVRERFEKVQKRIVHMAAVVNQGVFVKLNFMLMAKWTGYRNYTIFSSFDHAVVDVRERIRNEKMPI